MEHSGSPLTYNLFEEGRKIGYEQGIRKVLEMLKQPPYIDFLESWVLDEVAEKFHLTKKGETV